MFPLFPYQVTKLAELDIKLQSSNDVVLGACPSSGKTIMMLEFVRRTPGRFLILTHGQSVIRDMWSDKIKARLSADEQSRVVFDLPQSLSRKQIPVVDYVIVDEAHQFTFAEMVQKILKANSAAKKIYLTGTPAVFVALKYPIVNVAALDLIEQGYIADLYVGVCSTTANLSDDDRNNEGDLTKTGSSKLSSTVTADLDTLLDALLARLKSTISKDNPDLYRTLNLLPSLGGLGQTLIACASVAQAEKVLNYFKRKKIKATGSDSKNDPENENIRAFTKDSSIKVLVVVDRGVLGFDMPHLENVVDMTGSTNINRIYQLYARVMRKCDEVPKKYFFKLSSVEEMQLTKFYMQASLCLMHESFIARYNGKNLNEMEMPVKIERSKSAGKKSKSTSVSTSIKNPVIDELFMEQVTAAKILIDVYNKADEALNEYAMVKIGEIQKAYFGFTPFGHWDLTNCLSEAKKYMRKIDWVRGSGGSYKAAQTNGWLDECCVHMVPREWTQERCKAQAEKFNSPKEWRENCSGSYSAAHKNGWYAQLSAHMTHPRKPWTLEECKAEALKFSTTAEWLKKSSGSYYAAVNRGWLAQCRSHMRPIIRWELESCKREASKHNKISHWIKSSGASYRKAKSMGWLEICCTHMKREKANPPNSPETSS